MWPVARKYVMDEQEKESFEFHDMDELKHSDEEEMEGEEGDDDNDAENGCAHKKNYHFSPSLIKQRGFNSLHQVSN